MLFLVQSNIYSDPDHNRIFDALHDLNIPFEKIQLNSETQEITVEADRTDVFVYGSVKLARLAKSNTHWNPGSFYGGNHQYEIYSTYYQENLLNYDVEVFQFEDPIDWKPNEQKFIKPYKDAKIFTGKVFTKTKWTDFVENSLENPKTPLLHAKSLVQASIPKEIYKEARLWIVGGQIVAAVYYKFNGDVVFEAEVAEEGIVFAKKMIQIYEVDEAFVMDICLTNYGWKIVEINCINSAGFYPNLNVHSLVKALDIYFSN
ncbi:ATP-grasp domain-containing protein [uncultured Kordia sp.]|uniref:ATP-grasp domain-containing protein n=1 Tax=uncultured Kordia sp. TaxID=507699 RepID=UPI002618741A|nr:ATP-grasp domain-containing protein [uncultured Kordia sp.]